ncbi:MAG: hypothetical protein F4Y07_02620 [Gemmatimonadetes bacterium]|nr:hypothetical protein [Gemmatimonadota bacterium]MYE15351.1 hypothetical protein [Gemmatimonadota bacterium]
MQVPTIVARGAGGVLSAALLTACAGDPSAGDRSAGDVKAVPLGQADAAWDEGFSVLSTVRELPGGRVLVADPISQIVVALDLDAGVADTIGGVGSGPAEYRQPDAVWPLPEGRTLLVDLGNGRLSMLSPDLEFGDTRPFATVDPREGTVLRAIPHAVDGAGRIYFGGLRGSAASPDSMTILRLDFDTDAVDSVGVFKRATITMEFSDRGVRTRPVPLSPTDAWGVAADGRVVVARAGDYSVEWIATDGTVTRGAPTPYTARRIGRAEKMAWRDMQAEIGGGLTVRDERVNGEIRRTVLRPGSREDEAELDSYEWPAFLPPFSDRPILVDGAGRAWVRRHRETDGTLQYDLFDGIGAAVLKVGLDSQRRVVGFGDATLYAVRMDGYGLQYLERYVLP